MVATLLSTGFAARQSAEDVAALIRPATSQRRQS